MTDRREFLKGTAWMGAAAVAAGCMGRGAMNVSDGAPMRNFKAPPMSRIRVGLVGAGNRRSIAVRRFANVPRI